MNRKIIIFGIFALFIGAVIPLDLIDVIRAADPVFTLVDEQFDGGGNLGIWGDGSYVYMAGAPGGAKAYSFNGNSFTLLDGYDVGGSEQIKVWGDGSYIYVSLGFNGVRAYTFNGVSFSVLDEIDDGGDYEGVWCDGSYVYVTCEFVGIRAYQFNGVSFTLLDTQNDGVDFSHIWGDGSYIYTACESYGIRAYSFDGANFNLLDSRDDGTYGRLWGDGSYIYAACRDDGLKAYSFDGISLSLLDERDDGGHYNAVWGDGTYIYTACRVDGMKAYSFNGASFTLIDEFDDGDHEHLDVWGYGSYIYAALYDGGIRAYTFEGSGNSPPSVNIIYPENNDDVSGVITITGNASDPDGDSEVKKVRVKIGSSSWKEATGTISWSFVWDTTSVQNGSYMISVYAYDKYLKCSETKSISVNVVNVFNNPPDVFVTYPDEDSILAGTVNIMGTACDDDGNESLVKVEVKIDNNVWKRADGKTSWSYSWDTVNETNGPHTIYARSNDGEDYSDVKFVDVIVDHDVGNQPPNVGIIFPVENDNLSNVVVVSGVASDPNGNDTLTLVEVKIDDGDWNLATGTSVWSFSWDTTDETNGTHSIYARSYDGEIYSEVVVVNVSVFNCFSNVVIDSVNGGFRVSVDVRNNDVVALHYVDWSIDLEGGFILVGGHTSGVIDELDVGSCCSIWLDSLFGIGSTTITVNVGEMICKQASGFILGPLVLNVREI